MENNESRARLIEKTRLKKDTYRAMGRSMEDLHTSSDANIFNDHDLYQVLLSDFLQGNENGEEQEGDGHDSETERHFLAGADLSLTHKYLQKKQRLQ